MATGKLEVEKVGGKSTVTRCYSKYPLKFIIPKKVGPSQTDAVWIYIITYGGGIVSGDSICCEITVSGGCTTVLTTQASTKVYKSVGSKCSEQMLQARIGSDALLAVIPDPVTCFSTAKYSQKQVFNVISDSNLLIVDWITSGRHQRGEKWDFELYKSTNHIFLETHEPLFLDTVRLLFQLYFQMLWIHLTLRRLIIMVILLKVVIWTLHGMRMSLMDLKVMIIHLMHLHGIVLCARQILLEKGSCVSIAERMQEYQVIAMIVLFGPKLKFVQDQIQDEVKKLMAQQLHIPSFCSGHHPMSHNEHHLMKPSFIASCSVFGRKGTGLVVRIAAMTTESVYSFLQQQLSSLEPLLGISPYC